MFRFQSRLPRTGRATLSAMAGMALAAWSVAALIGATAPGLLAEDPPPATDDKPAGDDKPLKFSDDDLEKYHKPAPAAPAAEQAAPARDAQPAKPAPVPATGKVAPAAKPATSATPAPAPRPAAAAAPIPAAAAKRPQLPPPDPLKKWKDREELENFREGQLRDLRTKISGIESRLEYLNLKRLSILDPTRIMPMPQTEDDRTNDKGKGSRDLLASVEKEIETANADLTQARADLITIETRFAQESGRP